jgi:hypothetical protein
MHMGKYPMEKIKRIDIPTTLITDNVKRVPKRANFFIRGDFGEKVLYNGYEIWKPDVGKCVRYHVNNPGGSACGRCRSCDLSTGRSAEGRSGWPRPHRSQAGP